MELKELYGLNALVEQESVELTEWKSADGVTCQTAAMMMKMGESSFAQMEIVIAPDKNLVVTLLGEYGEEDRETEVKEQIAVIKESLLFRTGNQDFVSSNTFITDEDSQLCLKDDNSFHYYQSEKKVYQGSKEALEAVLLKDMSGYKLKNNSILAFIRAMYPDLEFDEDEETVYRICRDTFYVIVLHNDHVVLTNGEIKDGGYDTTYVGYYISELDVANPSCGSYFNWVLQGKTAEMDVEPSTSS